MNTLRVITSSRHRRRKWGEEEEEEMLCFFTVISTSRIRLIAFPTMVKTKLLKNVDAYVALRCPKHVYSYLGCLTPTVMPTPSPQREARCLRSLRNFPSTRLAGMSKQAIVAAEARKSKQC